MLNWPRSLGLLALALTCLASGSAPGGDSAMTELHVNWNLTDLPNVLRSRVHIRASDLPPFQIERSLLKDPRSWPRTRVFAGVPCSLRVRSGSDVMRDIRSLDEVRPEDWWYCLYYQGTEGSSGPECCWDRSGWMFERSWHTPDSARTIYLVTTFWRSGEVLRCEWRNDSKKPKAADPNGPYEWFEEFFKRNGDLLACGYGKMDGSGKQVSARFWAGMEVTQEIYTAQTLELYRIAYPARAR